MDWAGEPNMIMQLLNFQKINAQMFYCVNKLYGVHFYIIEGKLYLAEM